MGSKWSCCFQCSRMTEIWSHRKWKQDCNLRRNTYIVWWSEHEEPKYPFLCLCSITWNIPPNLYLFLTRMCEHDASQELEQQATSRQNLSLMSSADGHIGDCRWIKNTLYISNTWNLPWVYKLNSNYSNTIGMSFYTFSTKAHLSSFNATTYSLARTTFIASSQYDFWKAIILAQQYITLHHMALARKRGYNSFLSSSKSFICHSIIKY